MDDTSELAAQALRRIETQHRVHARDVTAALDAMRRGDSPEVIRGLLDRLAVSLETHFRIEEDAAFDHRFPFAAEHALDHRAMASRLTTIQEAFALGDAETAVHLLATLEQWLVGHTRRSDAALEAHLRDKAAEAEQQPE